VAEEVHADAPDIVPELEPEPAPFVPPPPPPVEEDLVFVPASFTSFETLPPVIDPLVDPGFEPLILKPPVAPLPVAPLLHAVPPRAPGDIDPVLIDLPAYGSPGPSGLAVAVGLWCGRSGTASCSPGRRASGCLPRWAVEAPRASEARLGIGSGHW
jgi:hypothetical protein